MQAFQKIAGQTCEIARAGQTCEIARFTRKVVWHSCGIARLAACPKYEHQEVCDITSLKQIRILITV